MNDKFIEMNDKFIEMLADWLFRREGYAKDIVKEMLDGHLSGEKINLSEEAKNKLIATVLKHE
jgi:hypothetical protein